MKPIYSIDFEMHRCRLRKRLEEDSGRAGEEFVEGEVADEGLDDFDDDVRFHPSSKLSVHEFVIE